MEVFSFVILQRTPSLALFAVKSTLTRLEPHHFAYPILLAKSSQLEAGIAGEERVEAILNQHNFRMDHRILHDVSLSTSQSFQLDHIFSTSFYTLVLETKNLSGKLQFKENPDQLIQVRDNGQIQAYECPGAQVRRKCELLQEWYQKKNIQIPIYGVVVLAYPKQIVEISPQKSTILFPAQIPSYIRKLPQKPVLSEKDLHHLALQLKKEHQPYIPEPICKNYSIPREDILTGVKCTSCQSLGMMKIKRSWHCVKCGHRDQFAHIQTLIEWFLIVGEEMTNKDCRDFLHVDMKTATRILQSIDLQWKGARRNRKYQLNFQQLLTTKRHHLKHFGAAESMRI